MGNIPSDCMNSRAKVPQGTHVRQAINQIKSNNVEHVEIDYMGVYGVRQLAEALDENTSVKSLSISFTIMKPLDVYYLAKGVKLCSTLTSVTLIKCGIDDASDLGDLLAETNTLEKLVVCDNRKLGDEGAGYIADGLALNGTLKELRYQYNDCGDRGAIAFAKALAENRTLKKLDFWRNTIGDEGAKSLVDVIASNATLKKIDLSDNHLTELAVVELEEANKSRITRGIPLIKMSLAISKHPLSLIPQTDDHGPHWSEPVLTNKSRSVYSSRNSDVGAENRKSMRITDDEYVFNGDETAAVPKGAEDDDGTRNGAQRKASIGSMFRKSHSSSSVMDNTPNPICAEAHPPTGIHSAANMSSAPAPVRAVPQTAVAQISQDVEDVPVYQPINPAQAPPRGNTASDNDGLSWAEVPSYSK